MPYDGYGHTKPCSAGNSIRVVACVGGFEPGA